MTKLELLATLAATGNLKAVESYAYFCRFRLDMDYEETFQLVKEHAVHELTKAQWDGWLYELDENCN